MKLWQVTFPDPRSPVVTARIANPTRDVMGFFDFTTADLANTVVAYMGKADVIEPCILHLVNRREVLPS